MVIADRNAEKGEKLARELGDRVSIKKVDASDFSSLLEAFRGADAVVNTLGPFYHWGEKVLKAAIRAKVNLVDIDDDYDATQRCLEMDQEARNAGILAIVGLGTTPGLTNLLAKYGARGIEPEKIETSWVWTAVDPLMGPAIIYHFFHAISGEVPTYIDGRWVKVKALSEPEVVEFPAPFGRIEVANVGHPEPVTIPRYIRGVKKVTNKGTVWPKLLADLAKTFAMIGLTEMREVSLGSLTICPRDLMVELTLRLNELSSPELVESVIKEIEGFGEYAMGVALRVDVEGKKEDRVIRRSYSLVSPSAVRATALPAALGVVKMLRENYENRGVYPPEGIIEPGKFLRDVAKDFEIQEVEEKRGKLSQILE